MTVQESFESEAGESHDAPASRPVRRGRRVAFALGVSVCLLAGAFVGGAVAGWRWFDQRSVAGAQAAPAPEVVEVRVPALGASEDGALMPDVRGLDHDMALEVLADTVLAGEAPVVELRPWAGQPGIVIEQHPPFGVAEPVAITLVISEAAVVPDAVGHPLSGVIEELEALGTRVEIVRRFQEGVAADTVLEIDPPAGDALPAMVQVTASEQAASVFLATLTPVEGRCSRGEYVVDATAYQDALGCPVRRAGDEYAWLLSRAVERIEGRIGVPDNAPSDLVVAVDLLIDGQHVDSVLVGYGQPAVIDLAAAGGLRLTVYGTIVSDHSSFFRADMVLADMRLTGAADALAALQDGS